MSISWRKVFFWVGISLGIGALIAGAFVPLLIGLGVGLIAVTSAYGAIFLKERQSVIEVDEPQYHHVQVDRLALDLNVQVNQHENILSHEVTYTAPITKEKAKI